MSFLSVLLFTLISCYLLLHLGFCKAYQNCLVAIIKITTVWPRPAEYENIKQMKILPESKLWELLQNSNYETRTMSLQVYLLCSVGWWLHVPDTSSVPLAIPGSKPHQFPHTFEEIMLWKLRNPFSKKKMFEWLWLFDSSWCEKFTCFVELCSGVTALTLFNWNAKSRLETWFHLSFKNFDTWLHLFH